MGSTSERRLAASEAAARAQGAERCVLKHVSEESWESGRRSQARRRAGREP